MTTLSFIAAVPWKDDFGGHVVVRTTHFRGSCMGPMPLDEALNVLRKEEDQGNYVRVTRSLVARRLGCMPYKASVEVGDALFSLDQLVAAHLFCRVHPALFSTREEYRHYRERREAFYATLEPVGYATKGDPWLIE